MTWSDAEVLTSQGKFTGKFTGKFRPQELQELAGSLMARANDVYGSCAGWAAG
jgi:hypothetical protein